MTPSRNHPCRRGTSYYSHGTVLEYNRSYADDWEAQLEDLQWDRHIVYVL
jgi:hypothetical protein